MARACNRVEAGIYAGVLGFGRAMMHLGRGTRFTDEAGIDGTIFGFVRATIRSGKRARLLQSAMIHRSLALTITATGILAIGLFAAPLFY